MNFENIHSIQKAVLFNMKEKHRISLKYVNIYHLLKNMFTRKSFISFLLKKIKDKIPV